MSVVPHLTVGDARAAVSFYAAVFGARELWSNLDPASGRVLHCELLVADGSLYLNDEFPEHGSRGPASPGSSVVLHIDVDDPDATMAAAVAHGATEILPVEDRSWGMRYGRFRDPFGHVWDIARDDEDLAPEDIRRRTT